MRISYEGNKGLCDALLTQAKHAFFLTKTRGIPGQYVSPLLLPEGAEGVAEVVVTIGQGIDGVHIRAFTDEDQPWPGIPSFLSGAVINEGQLLNYKIPGTDRWVMGLDAFTPTIPTKEEYKFDGGPMVIKRLMVEPHVSMPTRIPLGGQQLFDSQYTSQQSSKYTGKMCKLVQVILSYGIPDRQAQLTAVMYAYATSRGLAFDKKPSILFSKENRKGIKNNFNFEYGRTNGVFTFRAMVEGKEVKKYWLVQISQSAGVQAMPLQLEPTTEEPAFKAYINSLAAKEDHPKFIEDIKKVLDEFGGLPTNEGFLTKNKAIKKTIRTVLPPENLKWYKDGRGVSTDHGWAFNSQGTQMNNVCLEEKGNGSWYVAHHCQITLGYDIEKDEFNAGYSVIESGSAPIGKHYLKVGDTVLDNCVSYNADLRARGDYSGRPRATATAMFVFYKDDQLQVLRWSEGHMDPATDKETTTHTKTGYRIERWSGANGIAAGFYCTSYDGRIPTISGKYVEEYNQHVANEKSRTITYAPSTDLPEYYSRAFHGWTERRTTNESGQTTHDSCAFIPLGDRSAFYIVSMTSTSSKTEDYRTEYLSFGDPYAYLVRDTYIWNFDFGTKCGTKYPFTYAGITLDGMAEVVWDRSGSRGKIQLDHYCQYYIWAPLHYKGAWSGYAWSQSAQNSMDAWTELTGYSDWYDVGSEPIPVAHNPMSEDIPPSTLTHEPSITRLKVWMMSLEKVGMVFEREGSYLQIYRDYNYWFDTSPNPDGDFQTMWAVRNCFGKAKYQLYSSDVNNRTLTRENGYPLDARTFPTFIGVVGDLTT